MQFFPGLAILGIYTEAVEKNKMEVHNNIFISYRRDDSADITGRIYDWLVREFGKESVFKDVDSIPLGIDFKEYITNIVSQCHILLVVIGKQWLTIAGKNGKIRLEDPGDFVAIEIIAALERNIPVIPLLVQNVSMPSEENLPSMLKKLAYRNGTVVKPDPDFHADMDRLIRGIKKHFEKVCFQNALRFCFFSANYSMAWQEICKASELHPDPTYLLLKATMLWDGQGCSADKVLAQDIVSKAFPKAILKQDSFSYALIGECYYKGIGVIKNFLEAFEWFKKSANLNDPYGINWLGVCYYKGNGVAQNYNQAFQYFKQNADAGIPISMTNLGICYHNGSGVNQDHEKAKYWFKKSADAGNTEAKKWINKSSCFIATAVYGSYDHPKVLTLRQFRDSTLAKNRLGRISIKVYYFIGPKLAWFVHKSKTLHDVCQYFLDKFVARLLKKNG